jgi:hypothetical protein
MSVFTHCRHFAAALLLLISTLNSGLCVEPGETIVPGQGTTIPPLSPGFSKGAENSVEFGRQLRPTTVTLPSQGGVVPAISPIDDGAEIYNRGCFAFNDWIIKGFLKGSSILCKKGGRLSFRARSARIFETLAIIWPGLTA